MNMSHLGTWKFFTPSLYSFINLLYINCISIPGVRNVLQSQEVFLMDAKSNFFNFEDREESYISNCMYFEREIHWCTQNHLWTSSSMHQEGYIRNILVQIYFCKFLSYRKVWYINLYVLCETNPTVWSKSLMDIILWIRMILPGSGRAPGRWPGLLL